MREKIGLIGTRHYALCFGVCPQEVEAFVDQGIGSGHYTRNLTG